jgi:hypothetical protein
MKWKSDVLGERMGQPKNRLPEYGANGTEVHKWSIEHSKYLSRTRAPL